MSELVPNESLPNNTPSGPLLQPSAPPPVFESWWKAIASPSERTYAAIAASPNANVGQALLWVFLSALLEMIVYFLVLGPLQGNMLRSMEGPNTALPSSGLSALTIICGAPVGAVVMVLGFLLSSGVTHGVARAFSGKATYGQWAYTMAAIFVPMALISTVLLALEALGTTVALCVGGISLIVGLYAIVLQTIAIKAVQQISWGGAIVSAVVLPIALAVLIACITILVLMVLGPVIGNTFSTINSSLQSVP